MFLTKRNAAGALGALAINNQENKIIIKYFIEVDNRGLEGRLKSETNLGSGVMGRTAPCAYPGTYQ